MSERETISSMDRVRLIRNCVAISYGVFLIDKVRAKGNIYIWVSV